MISDTPIITLIYMIAVTTSTVQNIIQTASIARESIGVLKYHATIIVNGCPIFLPLIRK